MSKRLALMIAVAALGCGKKSSTPAKPLDVAAVNALVPASLKDKITFEKTDIVEERGRSAKTYTVAAPKGWKQEMKGFASLKPPRELGFMTDFEVGTNCDGACESKPWAEVIDKVYASYLKGKVIKDVKGKTSRTLIAESGDMTVVVVAWWDEGDRQYTHCGATLATEVKDLAPAVEKACESVTISGD